jgi:pimeloyl-ACP methyl ester carboxylesterase
MKAKGIFGALFLLAGLAYGGTYAFLYAIRGEAGNRFRGQTLPLDFTYAFDGDFEELTFEAADGGRLSSVLFKAPAPKGVVCFWKGNGGTLREWARIAPPFLELGYDVLLTDYRQHGKSRGEITLENFYADAQLVYDSLARRYPEDRIVVAGFSLGGRIAAHLAASNAPPLTLLLDPASATGDLGDRFLSALYAPLPPVIGFNFETEADVKRAPAPVAVVGTGESPYSLAHRLKSLLQSKDRFFEVPGATHGTLLTHDETKRIIAQLLP